METQAILLDDVRRFAATQSPDLPEVLLAFLEQGDVYREVPLPGTVEPAVLQAQLARAARYRTATKRVKEAREAWSRFLAQPEIPARFQLADVLVQLYQSGSEPGRAALIEIALHAPLVFGVWAGLKRVYKLAEERHDAEVFGALACRFDVAATGHSGRGREVSTGTLIYLRRRAWRFLRQLGASVPEVYPQFAVQVLRHYEAGYYFSGSWVANHVWGHGSKKYDPRRFYGNVSSNMMKHRAFPEAWKRSADPLMFLLESAQSDEPVRFAIEGLQKDFPDKLRNVTPAWLARLARRPLASVHDFLVATLQASPEFHQGKLKALGLHETVLALLTSPSKTARTYAIEYARAHATDISADRLLALIGSGFPETTAFAASVIKSRKPRELGYAFLGKLLAHESVSDWAGKALLESFERKELPEAFVFDLLYGGDALREWAVKYLEKQFQPGEIDAAFWKRVLDDPREKDDDEAREVALEKLGKFPAESIGADWLLAALTRDNLSYAISRMLKKVDALPGLDVEKLKGLVFNPAHRGVALELLKNNKLVKPRDIGLPWLLALARRADPVLHEFAHRYLLEHMRPEDFSETGDRAAGITKLFALALGEKEPEPVRTFAQTYLRCHHTGIGPEQSESKSLGIRPRMPRDAYTPERLWPALFDPRADVRRFAIAITRAELRRWNRQSRVYELAESEAKEVRNIAYDALLKIGDTDADPAITLHADELDPAGVFAMTESRRRPTREVAVELIRRHYARLGGAEKLGWLMQSADREVRLFAVRLLWEKHRPRALPPGWRPAKRANATGAESPVEESRFGDVEALRGFLRTVLYGLPPGRSSEGREEGGVRRVPASHAKRNVIEVVRDLGVEDPAFAQLIAPVLGEFTGSVARTEWQACLSALAYLRRAHHDLHFGGL